MKREIKAKGFLSLTVVSFKSGNKIVSAVKDNLNQCSFPLNKMSDIEIVTYATEKLNYEPVEKINLTSRISKAERLALC